ncbi:hypothetical protein AAHE18_04G099000 [Arachis hypogaea]
MTMTTMARPVGWRQQRGSSLSHAHLSPSSSTALLRATWMAADVGCGGGEAAGRSAISSLLHSRAISLLPFLSAICCYWVVFGEGARFRLGCGLKNEIKVTLGLDF